MLYDYPSPMCQAGEMVTGSSGDDGGSHSSDRLHSLSCLISDCSLTTLPRPYNLPVGISHCQMTLYGLIYLPRKAFVIFIQVDADCQLLD